MKSLHFCTFKHIEYLKNKNKGFKFSTYRTGFIPTIYSGDTLILNTRIDKIDTFARLGKVVYILPVELKELKEYSWLSEGIEEISETYPDRKFNTNHYFFEINIELIN